MLNENVSEIDFRSSMKKENDEIEHYKTLFPDCHGVILTIYVDE